MTSPQVSHYTEEQYLELEEAAAYKSEYYRGEIFAMAGAATNHNAIKENASFEIGSLLRRGKSCRNYSSDQRIHVPQNSLYTYPDIVVICGPNQYANLSQTTLINPTLIVEVLSPGTAAYDRGAKFAFYRSIPTLQEYLLIDSEEIRAEVFRKNEQGFWYLASEAQNISGSIELASIGLTLTMQAAYADTEGILA